MHGHESLRRQAMDPPQPRGLPLLGNLLDISRHGPIPYFTQLWQRHGDTFLVKVAHRRMLFVVNPSAVEHVLITNRDNYVKGNTYDDLRLLTGNGLLTMEGDAWRTRRRLEQPSFHRAGIDKLVRSMVEVTDSALTRLRARSRNGEIIEAHQEMMRLTLEIVGETLFGQRLDVERADASGRAFSEALQLVSDRGNSAIQLPLYVPTPGNVRFRRALKILDAETYSVIERARQEQNRDAHPTLLSMLIDARDADTGKPLEDVDLRNEVITLFLAGHETTALLLTWAFVFLGKHPEVVERMREEVERVLGGRAPTMDDCQKLTYVRNTIDEILRLRPPVWSVARDALNDDEIDGVRVRRDDILCPMAYLTHRHPEFWSEPERFDPERFLPEQARNRPRAAYYPFSIGPRVCIGNTFALVETQIILSMLLQRAEFSLAQDREFGINPGSVTTRPNEPVPVRLRFRD